MDEKTIARFWSKVDKNGPVPTHRPELGPCWVWTARVGNHGYGEISVRNRKRLAHRFAWEFLQGDMALGDMCVLHKCDNRACVNVSHHFLGTRTENCADKMSKGRYRDGAKHRGESNPGAKLTATLVLEARASTEPQSVVAARMGVSRSLIRNLRLGKAWRHL